VEALGSVKKCEKCGWDLELPPLPSRRELRSPDIYYVDNGLASAIAAKMRYVGIHELIDNCPNQCQCGMAELKAEGDAPMFIEEHIERTCPRCGYIWPESCAG